MIGLLLAGVCAATPIFGATGVVCNTQTQTIECQCTECMMWDAVPGAEWYEVGRQDPGMSGVGYVGSTANKVDYGVLPPVGPTSWCFAFDNPMPREGVLYLYRVRACAWGAVANQNVLQCSGWSSRSVDYVTAPYAVDQFQPPVVGN